MPFLAQVLCIALIALGPIGRTKPPIRPPATPDSDSRPGVVIVVCGIGGIDFVALSSQWALPRAGVRHEIREFSWTHGKGRLLRDLQDTQHCLRKADELAEEVRKIKAQNPDRPVYLVGKSGGTGIILAAAEQLPPQTLERVVLLSPAVAPNYDLRRALRATRYQIVSFYSPYDQLVLNWGTSQFGTIDRYYGASAGLRGFVIPPDLSAEDRALYDRLVQVKWSPAMILEGNLGVHIGTSMPAFVAKEVAPWLKP
ncbi:MAG TPA: alpha/beta fold hydrolase [Gemmataceae bacterium]|nr:alpha/beta fold hydrolase [Gemmataceae bacterium]